MTMIRSGMKLVLAIVFFTASMLQAQEELKIGGVGALSGGGTAWGLAIQRGIQLAIDEVNAAGGLKVGGKVYKPRLVMLDDQFTASGGRTAAERLVNVEKVRFIIGPHASPSVIAMLPVTTDAQVLFLSDGFASEVLRNQFHSPYNYRMTDTTVEFGPPMIQWLHKTYPNLKKAGIIAANDATGQASLQVLGAAYKANGFEVWQETFDRGTKEFTPLLTRMKAQGVDVFDLGSNSPGDGGLMVKQARAVGYKNLIWQVGGPSVDEIISVAGPLAEGFLSLDCYDFTTPEGKKFEQMYHAKWGGIINGQTPAWYNAARILFEALRHADTTDTAKVRDALEHLEGTDFGTYGPVVWGGKADYGVNHQLLLPFWIVEVKGGKEIVRQKLIPVRK